MATQTVAGMAAADDTSSMTFERFAGICAILTGVVGFLYSIAFVFIGNQPWLYSLLLMVGGLLAMPVLVALFHRLRHAGGDFFGCCSRALGKFSHLVGHYGKSAALFTGARSFDGRVQGEQISFVGNLVNDGYDPANLLGALSQFRDLSGDRLGRTGCPDRGVRGGEAGLPRPAPADSRSLLQRVSQHGDAAGRAGRNPAGPG